MSKKVKVVKINTMASLVIMLIISGMICALAKYYRDYNTKAIIDNTKIADYYIDITGDGSKVIPLETVSLENLNPGEVKEIPIVIRNGYTNSESGKSIISDVDIIYSIEILHTENLPLTYTLIDSENNVIASTSVTEGSESQYLNNGKNILYDKDIDGRKFEIETNNGLINSDSYILKISWNIDDNDSKYVKEIDAIYLKMNSYQEKPA